ncbi:MAG: 1-acyl-sn-glycerol-3-phosphate acyltransferase [Clostridia bacterium]|nr:1-acyl-sn-glycerol-3-phosphate acyltransferase [Clostridia bacterium]
MYFLFNWFVKITGWPVYWAILRPKISYENKKVQSRRIKGRAIVISNHRNVLDVAVAMFTFRSRTLRCAAAELMYRKNFFMTFMLRGLGMVKVDRDLHDFSFLSAFGKILDRGGVVEIYPEARIPKSGEQTPLEFKPSAVYLALQTGAPIIPICQNGRYFTNKRMRVIIGTPINVRSLYRDELSEKDNIDYITNHIREKIIEFQKQLEQQEKEAREIR